MANILLLNQPFVSVGLDDYTFTVPSTGNYHIALQCTEVPPSGLTIVVNDNGSPIFTAPVITPTQQALQFKVGFQSIAGHTIDVVLTSSEAIDSQLNTVKTSVSLGNGF